MKFSAENNLQSVSIKIKLSQISTEECSSDAESFILLIPSQLVARLPDCAAIFIIHLEIFHQRKQISLHCLSPHTQNSKVNFPILNVTF